MGRCQRLPYVFPRMREVDWSFCWSVKIYIQIWSSLGWGKWIEVTRLDGKIPEEEVFPRMREVDWSTTFDYRYLLVGVFPRMREVDWSVYSGYRKIPMDPSSLGWGKWIEVLVEKERKNEDWVFPRMREVDWSWNTVLFAEVQRSLPSDEGSGLKLIGMITSGAGLPVFPRMREVDWSKVDLKKYVKGRRLPSDEGSGLKRYHIRSASATAPGWC